MSFYPFHPCLHGSWKQGGNFFYAPHFPHRYTDRTAWCRLEGRSPLLMHNLHPSLSDTGRIFFVLFQSRLRKGILFGHHNGIQGKFHSVLSDTGFFPWHQKDRLYYPLSSWYTSSAGRTSALRFFLLPQWHGLFSPLFLRSRICLFGSSKFPLPLLAEQSGK